MTQQAELRWAPHSPINRDFGHSTMGLLVLSVRMLYQLRTWDLASVGSAGRALIMVAAGVVFVGCANSRPLRPRGDGGGADGGNPATTGYGGTAGSVTTSPDGGPPSDLDTLPPAEQAVEARRTNVVCSDGVSREFVEFFMPVAVDLVGGVASGPDANIWFTLTYGDAIGRLNPKGSFVQFSCPADSVPRRITAGPDGNLWFTLEELDAIGRISPTGTIVTFPLSSQRVAHRPGGITTGPDGNIWFAESSGEAVGRITPTGSIVEFPARSYSGFAIAAGADGNMWLTPGGPSTTILRMSLAGQTTAFKLPQTNGQSYPWHITSGPDGNLWFTEDFGKNVGRITPTGAITEFPIPNVTDHPVPGGITSGTGFLWLAMQNMNAIFRVSTSGDMTACPFPYPDPNGGAGDITMGPDGRLYFLMFGNKIGSFTP